MAEVTDTKPTDTKPNPILPDGPAKAVMHCRADTLSKVAWPGKPLPRVAPAGDFIFLAR
jgi:hypothetical protein